MFCDLPLSSEMTGDPKSGPRATGTPTRWALAIGATGEERKAASCWYCVYAWRRRTGLDAATAATATVGTFTRWLGDLPPAAADSGAERRREWLPARLAKMAKQGVEVELDDPGALEIDAE